MSDTLRVSAMNLPSVSQEAAQEYAKQQMLLVRYVNHEILNHPEKKHLTGTTPDRLLADNHRNHAMFMENVFLFGTHELMCRIVPWVYRAYSRHGLSFDYFPVALRVWQQAVLQYLTVKNAGEINAIYDWMIAHHDDFIALSSEPLIQRADVPQSWRDDQQQFLDALISGDHQRCIAIADAYVSDNKQLMGFYQHILEPAMYDVGSKWENGEISVAREHLASSIVARTMSMIYLKQTMPRGLKGTVIVTSASNEFHEIGAWLVANSLQMDDWNVLYLGSNTPNEDLVNLAAQEKPFFVAISVAMPFNLENARKAIALIQSDDRVSGVKIMVGGLAIQPFSDIASILGADGSARNAACAVALANQWLKESL